jgi:hypothetical protein
VHAMKTYGVRGVVVQFHAFRTLTLDVAEKSTSHPEHFTQQGKNCGTH